MRYFLTTALLIFALILASLSFLLHNRRDAPSSAYWVAYEETFTNNAYATNLAIMYPDGKLRLRIPMQDGYADRTPEWSSDGNDLYFTSFSLDSDVQIYRTSAYHDYPEPVFADGLFPQISPDSTYLAYTHTEQVEVRNLQTEQLVFVTEPVGEKVHYNPLWLSDNQLLFLERAAKSTCLYQLNLTTAEVTPLPVCDLLTQSIAVRISLAPNSKWIAIEANFGDEIDGKIILWGFHDNAYRVLVGDTLGYTSYGWSWDSRHFFSFSYNNEEPYLYDMHSGDFQVITHPHQIQALAWSPDNRGFFYTREEQGTRNIYWQNVHSDKIQLQQLTQGTFDHFFDNPVPSPLIDLIWHPLYLGLLSIVLFSVSVSRHTIYQRFKPRA